MNQQYQQYGQQPPQMMNQQYGQQPPQMMNQQYGQQTPQMSSSQNNISNSFSGQPSQLGNNITYNNGLPQQKPQDLSASCPPGAFQ